MNEKRKKWKVARIFHLSGGARAINSAGPSVELLPDVGGKVLCFESSSYENTFVELKQLGFSIVGVDFYQHEIEAQGGKPPLWMVVDGSQAKHKTTDAVSQLWARISHNAFKQQNALAWDISSRICHQLRTCTWRVKQLSECYNEQLTSRLKSNDSSFGQRYNNEDSWRTYLAIQTYFIDANILADYLAEFVVEYVLKQFGMEASLITSMAQLNAKILTKKDIPDIPFIQNLRDITNKNGWLKELIDYRSLVVHSAPLIQANKLLFSVDDAICMKAGNMPLVRINLPENPSEIKTKRSSRQTHFNDFEKFLSNYKKSLDAPSGGEEALNYIVSAHLKLVELVSSTAEYSPYDPDEIIIS